MGMEGLQAQRTEDRKKLFGITSWPKKGHKASCRNFMLV